MLSTSTSNGLQEINAVSAGKFAKSDSAVRSVEQMERQLDYVVDLIASDRPTSPASVDQYFELSGATKSQAGCLRFSVILTCQSHVANLRAMKKKKKKSMEQIAGQHEIILVDAVWHQAATAICQELGITLAVAPRNRLGSMRAIGVRNATGDVLTFVDLRNVEALKCMPDHVTELLKGCDVVQSDGSPIACEKRSPLHSWNQICSVGRDVLRSCVANAAATVIRWACGINTRVFENPIQSIRRSLWDQLRLTEQGTAASLELSLRCAWSSNSFAEFGTQARANSTQPPRIRQSLKLLCESMRIAVVQRPDRMIVAPAVATFVCALAMLAWTILSARMLGSLATLVWTGTASVTMMIAALWVTAGWVATEYARQRKWMVLKSQSESCLRTISTKSSFIIGGSLITAGMLMMSLGAWIGASESAVNSLSSTWTMSNTIAWVWPGATMTLIGHQLSMAGMLVSWFRRQPLQ